MLDLHVIILRNLLVIDFMSWLSQIRDDVYLMSYYNFLCPCVKETGSDRSFYRA